MINIIWLIFPFFALIGIGFVAGRAGRYPVDGLTWLNVFVIYIALPSLFFQLLSHTPIEKLASGAYIAATTFATFAIFTVGFCLAAASSRGDARASTIQALAAAYGNIGYMGPGVALVAFGPAAAVPVALIVCFDNILLFILAPTLMALGGERNSTPWALALGVVYRILTHPFIVATILGVSAAFAGLTLPEPAERLVGLLVAAAAPCALFAMGVTLALRPLKRFPTELGYIVPLKLVAHPLAVWLLLGLAGSFDPLWVKSAILLASLPTATNVFVIAQQYEVWIERASAAILVSTLLSVATVTLALYLLTSGWIPVDPFPN